MGIINYNARIYNLRVEIIDEIEKLFKESGRKEIHLGNVYNMACDCDYLDITIETVKYDGHTLTLVDNEGYEYGIGDISSVDELANLYTTIYEIVK